MDTFENNNSFGRQPFYNVTIGRIIEIDNRNNTFTTIGDGGSSSVIRFNTSNNTRIIDPFGRRIAFSRLFRGLRVRVRHATFMTPSIPPQTTAFEVRILR